MNKIIFANWKMNPPTFNRAEKLFNGIEKESRGLNSVLTILSPPFVYLQQLAFRSKKTKQLEVCGQDLFWKEGGPYTGEVSARMLRDVGAKYVIVGHSERRRDIGEDDILINRKFLAAINGDLVPVLCVGEWSRKGKSWQQIKKIVIKQLKINLKNIASNKVKKVIITYEPVWAISTVGGGPDKPEDSAKMIKFIKEWVFRKFTILNERNTRFIYGGSVNEKNAKDFFAIPEIEGALVGGASLKVSRFSKILHVAEKY